MKSQLVMILLGAAFMLTACGESAQSKKARTEHEHLNRSVNHSGPEYTSKYICPMHCKGSGSDTTGICPVCKMDYVENGKD